MTGLRGAVRSAMLALIVLALLATAWVCLIAGLIQILSVRIGAGPALLAVGGGLVALVAVPLSIAALTRKPDAACPRVPFRTGALSALLSLLAARGGGRLPLLFLSALFTLLALGVLGLSMRPTDGKGTTRHPPG